MRQIEINFTAGLIEQYPDFKDCVKASVYSCGRSLKSIAADLDMSVSELSRKLADNPNDPVNFPLHLLPDLIRSTGSNLPIYWLVEDFLEDPDTKRKRVIDQVAEMLPLMASLLKQELETRGKGRKR